MRHVWNTWSWFCSNINTTHTFSILCSSKTEIHWLSLNFLIHAYTSDKCLLKLMARWALSGCPHKQTHIWVRCSCPKECPPPCLPVGSPNAEPSPPAVAHRSFGLKWPQLLLSCEGCKSGSKGFWHMIQHLWCHQQLTCHKTLVKGGGVRDEWGEGLIFNRPLAGTLSAFASSCRDYKLNDCH